MAITNSWGYAGTIDAAQWAKLAPYALGMQYGVKGFADWRPTIGGAGDRAVTLAEGAGWGHGVMDVNDAPVTLNLPAVAADSRWDLIVARRVWGTKRTTFERVAGSTVKQIPTRLNTPGTEDEQPIALARVAAGSATVAELIDLRCTPGDSGLGAYDKLALQYLTRPSTRVVVGNVEWRRVVDSMGLPSWAAYDITPDTGWVEGIRNGGWVFGWCQFRRIGSLVFYRINAGRTLGWSATNNLCAIPQGFRPDADHYQGSTHKDGPAEFAFRPNGNVDASGNSNGRTNLTLTGSYPAAPPA